MERLYFFDFKTCSSGFSIAEILICLALVGILAVFSVPHLTSMVGADLSSKQTAKAKSAALMIAIAYDRYKAANSSTVPASFVFSDMQAYLNYVKVDSSNTIDTSTGASLGCSGAGKQCLMLHNGGTIYYNTTVTFGGTNTTNAIWIGFDPDGTRNGQPSLGMALTYGGFVKSYGNIDQTYYYYSATTTAIAAAPDPAWFQGF